MMTKNVYGRFQGPLCLILSLLLLICLISCYPEFKNPIPPPSDLKADPKILGTWVRTYKVDQSEYKEQLSIFTRSSGWIDVVWIYDIDKKESADGISLLVLEGYSTSINKQRFLCLRIRKRDFNWAGQKNPNQSDKETEEQPFTKHWIIANYETPNNKLVVKPFSMQRVEELIERGKLKGDVVKQKLFRTPEQPFDQVTVTSSSEELVKVISKEGADAIIWDDPNDIVRDMNILVFSRVSK